MEDDALAPCSHGCMWSEDGHFCYLLMSRQTQPELFVQRKFPECGPHLWEVCEMILAIYILVIWYINQ